MSNNKPKEEIRINEEYVDIFKEHHYKLYFSLYSVNKHSKSKMIVIIYPGNYSKNRALKEKACKIFIVKNEYEITESFLKKELVKIKKKRNKYLNKFSKLLCSLKLLITHPKVHKEYYHDEWSILILVALAVFLITMGIIQAKYRVSWKREIFGIEY